MIAECDRRGGQLAGVLTMLCSINRQCLTDRFSVFNGLVKGRLTFACSLYAEITTASTITRSRTPVSAALTDNTLRSSPNHRPATTAVRAAVTSPIRRTFIWRRLPRESSVSDDPCYARVAINAPDKRGYELTRSFNSLPALKPGTLRAGI